MSTSNALLDLTIETNKIIVDAIVANNRRQIAYAKSVWGVVAVPFPGNDLKVNVDETIERVEKVADLTMSDLETTAKSTIELAEKIAGQGVKAREESLVAAREFAKTSVSTIKHALETAEERLEHISKRLEEAGEGLVAEAKKVAASSN